MIFYPIFIIQLVAGFINWGNTSTLPSEGLKLESSKKGITFLFLVCIYFPLCSILPLGALEWLNKQRKSNNRPIPVKIPRDAAGLIYSTLHDFYVVDDLKGFTVNNAVRRSEVNLNKGLRTIACGSIVHSLIVSIEIWLFGVLDVTLTPMISNELSYLIKGFNFTIILVSLMILAVLLAQHSFELRLSGYRFHFAKKAPSMEEYFKEHYLNLQKTWNSVIYASLLVSFIMLFYLLMEGSALSLFHIQNWERHIITLVFVIADIITFCSDSSVMKWGSLPGSFCCLSLAIFWFLVPSENHNDSSQSKGHDRHLLLFYPLLVRLTVVFVRFLKDACHHFYLQVPWTMEEWAVLKRIGLGFAVVICCWISSLMYSIS